MGTARDAAFKKCTKQGMRLQRIPDFGRNGCTPQRDVSSSAFGRCRPEPGRVAGREAQTVACRFQDSVAQPGSKPVMKRTVMAGIIILAAPLALEVTGAAAR